MSIDKTKMIAELRRDEGVRESAYQDHLGFWTIGVGHLIDARKGGTINSSVIDTLLSGDIELALADIQNESWFLACDTDNRKRALVNMRFQLGHAGIRTFANSLALIHDRKWLEAGKALRQSLWYKQTPERAERVIQMIEKG